MKIQINGKKPSWAGTVQESPAQTAPPKKVQLAQARGDVNGDGIADTVTLVGQPTEGGVFYENIEILIQNGQNHTLTSIPLHFGGGYSPQLFLGKFTNSRAEDILVTLDTGGSGGYVWSEMYSFLNNTVRPLYDPQVFNQGLPFTVNYLNDYRVRVSQVGGPRTFIIDVSNRKEEYRDIYGPDGRLLHPVEGGVLALGGLYPIATAGEKPLSLLALQRIIGINNSDTLGYVAVTWQWKNTQFVPVLINGVI